MVAIDFRPEQTPENMLNQIARAKVVIALQTQQWLHQLLWQHGIPRLQARRERLGKRHRQDHMLVGRFETLDARHIVSRKTQLAIGGIFQNQDATRLTETARQVKKLPAP